MVVALQNLNVGPTLPGVHGLGGELNLDFLVDIGGVYWRTFCLNFFRASAASVGCLVIWW